MSELANIKNNEREFRRQLLASVSTLVIFISVAGHDTKASEEDSAGRPTVWIELGGELDRLTGQGDAYDPGFLSKFASSPILQDTQTPLQAQQPLPFSFGGEAKVSFQPNNSPWSFQASVRYGRSSNKKDVHHQTDKIHYSKYKSGHVATTQNGRLPNYFTQENFVDTAVEHAESHAIVDFTAGKDVGLGMFGKNSSSTVNFGVRIAQFSSRALVDMRARPDLKFSYLTSGPVKVNFGPYFHSYHATMHATRSFHGVGPTVSWTGSTPFVGNQQDSELTFDWGVNGALLFGRQKADVHHQGYGRYWPKYAIGIYDQGAHLVYASQDTNGHRTAKSIIVPNVGGFAGVSFRYADAKISLGYRADFFFGPMDVGIDARKSENVGFYGPFANVSIGLGG